jgi:hypothetical protein
VATVPSGTLGAGKGPSVPWNALDPSGVIARGSLVVPEPIRNVIDMVTPDGSVAVAVTMVWFLAGSEHGALAPGKVSQTAVGWAPAPTSDGGVVRGGGQGPVRR